MHCLGKAQKLNGGKIEDFKDVPCDTTNPQPNIFTQIRINQLNVSIFSNMLCGTTTCEVMGTIVCSGLLATNIMQMLQGWKEIGSSNTFIEKQVSQARLVVF